MIVTLDQLSQKAANNQPLASNTTLQSPVTIPEKMQQNIELTARSVLLHALIEKRIVYGFPAAIKTLSTSSNDSIFCFLAQPSKDDSATNMNHTLLEAYCYENDIYVIKVDSAKKLSRILGICPQNTCVLIQKTTDKQLLFGNDDDDADDDDDTMEILTTAEKLLVDYCELHWDVPNKILNLPG